jgi:hypothetical protein
MITRWLIQTLASLVGHVDSFLIITIGYYGGPIFIFELTMGFWLLLRGLRAVSHSRAGEGKSVSA